MNELYLDEALECIDNLDNMEFSRSIETYVPLINSNVNETQFLCNTNEFYIVKQALSKAKKELKALETLKKHFNFKFDDDDDMLLISIQAKEDEDEWDCTACANIKLLSYDPKVYNENAKEEFELLKEVFE